ncbi:Multidomain esterase [Paramyrothecium foliicola]|nr:Multidomain esterase [Paramyrothecium foliicola]
MRPSISDRSSNWLTFLLFLFHLALPAIGYFPPTPPGISEAHKQGLEADNLKRAIESSVAKRTVTRSIRLLGLGSSSTEGTGSQPKDGYRKPLRDLLSQQGYEITFNGPFCHGPLPEASHAGRGGDTLQMVKDRTLQADGFRKYAPNLIIVYAGTNNCPSSGVMKEDPVLEMKGILDELIAKNPNVMILVGLQHKTQEGTRNQCLATMNKMLGDAVAEYATKQVGLVDVFGTLTLQAADFADSIHLNNNGYAKLAKVFHDAMFRDNPIMSAPSPTFEKPACQIVGGNNTCAKKDAIITKHLLHEGSGSDDGLYQHKSERLGQVINGRAIIQDTRRVRWADINGDGKDDYTFILRNGPGGKAALYIKLNSATTEALKFQDAHSVQSLDSFCADSELFEWGDVDGDGRDDMICITSNGGLRASKNLGGTPGQIGWGEFVSIRDPVAGYKQADVLLGDIDGDGRVDYLLADSGQEVIGYRNGGPTPGWPTHWQALGNVFHGGGNGKRVNWRLADLNGDGRDDWLIVSDTGGEVTTWINYRGHARGQMVKADQVTFPRLGINNSKRADYSVTDADGNATLFRNTGSGGKFLKGDGARFCDMYGRGTDDYVWISDAGELTLWPNNGGTWGDPVVINNGSSAQQNGVTRPYIQLADFTGNQKCDLLHISVDGSVRMWENNLSPGNYQWTDRGIVFNANNIGKCDIRGVRFPDLNGDGKMDYICLAPNATAAIWLNPGPVNTPPRTGIWINKGRTQPAANKERENIRFADINGDGLWDFLWVDQFTGAVEAWTNNGVPATGQTWAWTPNGQTSTGVCRGACVQFANVNPKAGKRADYIDIEPTTSKSYAYFNECPAS